MSNKKLNRPVKIDYRKNQLEPSLSCLAKQGWDNLENPIPINLVAIIGEKISDINI